MKSTTTRRALILLPHDLPGGAERVTMTVAEAALRSGIFGEVVVFVQSRGDNGTMKHIQDHPNARVVFAKSERQRGGLGPLLKICSSGRYDFTFSSFLELNAIACLFRRIGILKTSRLVTRESTTIFERNFGWKTPFIRNLYRLYGSQDLIVCQTNRMADSLKLNVDNRLHSMMRTIPNPVSYSLEQNLSSTEVVGRAYRQNRIVWCGRISHVKSPRRAIETLAALHKLGHDEARLLVIGDGPMMADTRDFASSIGVGSRIEFTGFLADPMSIMRTCQAGLVTSDVEGYPNVIVEMLCSGVAGVASTNCAGDLDEIPGVLVATEPTPGALAEALSNILSKGAPPKNIGEFLKGRNPGSFLQQLF